MDYPEGHFPHKEALYKRGFLVYVSRTYRVMVPYLKGIHLSIYSWRPDRDEDWWRTTKTCEPRLGLKLESEKVPKFVKMVKRWKSDLRVLLSFVAKEFPPEPLSKPTALAVGYMMGDASGTGLGSSFFVSDSPTITIIEGKWSAAIR